jgi:hypothetical protein
LEVETALLARYNCVAVIIECVVDSIIGVEWLDIENQLPSLSSSLVGFHFVQDFEYSPEIICVARSRVENYLLIQPRACNVFVADESAIELIVALIWLRKFIHLHLACLNRKPCFVLKSRFIGNQLVCQHLIVDKHFQHVHNVDKRRHLNPRVNIGVAFFH